MSKFNITGSVLEVLGLDGQAPMAGLLLYPCGNLRTVLASPVSGSRDDEEAQDYREAVNILTFLLYALERTDWYVEFDDHERKLASKFQAEVEALEKAQRRSHLTLIEGGNNVEN